MVFRPFQSFWSCPSRPDNRRSLFTAISMCNCINAGVIQIVYTSHCKAHISRLMLCLLNSKVGKLKFGNMNSAVQWFDQPTWNFKVLPKSNPLSLSNRLARAKSVISNVQLRWDQLTWFRKRRTASCRNRQIRRTGRCGDGNGRGKRGATCGGRWYRRTLWNGSTFHGHGRCWSDITRCPHCSRHHYRSRITTHL